MTMAIPRSDFSRAPVATRATVFDGLSPLIDRVAEAAPVSHAFLRRNWYAAALLAYGGQARTLVVERGGDAVIALPFAAFGPAAARLAAVPGCYWPFRGFPAAPDAGPEAFEVLATALARELNALRVGPAYDGDPATTALIAAAQARGWVAMDRFIADSYLLDLDAARGGEGGFPRNSTLRKNRFHEKHLADHGVPEWHFVRGAGILPVFDAMAAVEEKSWVATRTDGSDAKFTATGHGAFWRRAAADPMLANMLWAAILTIDDVPVAFSFDINVGPVKYAIANSYDPAFAKQSPGKLLYYRNLVRAMDDGITLVDWGAGDSGYKSVIGATRGSAIRDWMLVRPGAPAMLARLLRGGWRRSGQAEPQR